MTIRGLQRLLMILGGKVAAEYREIVESVFTRYTAGDTSLIEEVRANAASDAPENVSSSVYDFINFVTGHERGNAYARMTFERLIKEGSQYASETVTLCHSFKIQGSKGPETPCMTTRAACFEIESARQGTRQGTRQDTHACCDFGAGEGLTGVAISGPNCLPIAFSRPRVAAACSSCSSLPSSKKQEVMITRAPALGTSCCSNATSCPAVALLGDPRSNRVIISKGSQQ